jgi:hypothetical protein
MEISKRSKTKVSDSTSIYEFDYSSGLGYRFETKDSVIYTIRIGEYTGVQDTAFRLFSFYPCLSENKNKIKFDPRIHATICAIIEEYLELNNDHVLIYFCLDGKARYLLYNKWIKRFNTEASYNFYSDYFIKNGLNVYFGMISLKNCINWEHVELYAKSISKQEVDNIK